MSTLPTTGAVIRVTAEGQVRRADEYRVTLTNGIVIEWDDKDRPTFEVVTSGFQVGDVVRTGTAPGGTHLLRAHLEGYDCWIDTNGRRIHDDETGVEHYILVARANGDSR